jgi:hypothetical protein
MREADYWWTEGSEEQKRVEAGALEKLAYTGTTPDQPASIPLTNWWIRLDMVLLVHLLRGVIENVQTVVIALRIVMLLLLVIAGLGAFALYHWLTI